MNFRIPFKLAGIFVRKMGVFSLEKVFEFDSTTLAETGSPVFIIIIYSGYPV